MTISPEKAATDSFAAAEQATDQVRQFGERAQGAGREFSKLALDTYEQAVATFVELEQKAAETAPVDWVKAALTAHASFVEDMNAAYVRAARSVID
jgi:hypothetical protein